MPSLTSRSSLKIALIADDITRECLAQECRILSVTPWNAAAVLKLWRPDLLFVESVWRGRWDQWRRKIAAYPGSENADLARIVTEARKARIPAVFWNREDGVHFERFIESARLFDHVFTVDENMEPLYRARLGEGAKIGVLMFAAQPRLHAPAAGEPLRRAAFVGSYGGSVHPARRAWQDMMTQAAQGVGLTVYDRNSDRRDADRRYPAHPWVDLRKGVAHAQTAAIYRSHALNLNVNTITDSRTAFSRRLVEILACGGYAVTNATPAARALFGEYCAVVDDADSAQALFDRVAREGLSPREREAARAGAAEVLARHTWSRRLDQILEAIS